MEKRKADVPGLLSRLPLFSSVERAALDRIAEEVTEHKLARGERLFQQGDPCRGFYVVVHGQIKLGVTAPNGNEKVVELIPPHMSFGEAVMFLDRPYPVFAEALTESLVLHIPRAQLDALLEATPGLARRMLAGLSVRLHSLVKDVEAYSLRSSTQRLIGYLLRNADEGGEGREVIEVELPTSKQVLASRLSVTPETFSRILNALTSAGLVEVHGKNIRLLDLQGLRDYEA